MSRIAVPLNGGCERPQQVDDPRAPSLPCSNRSMIREQLPTHPDEIKAPGSQSLRLESDDRPQEAPHIVAVHGCPIIEHYRDLQAFYGHPAAPLHSPAVSETARPRTFVHSKSLG